PFIAQAIDSALRQTHSNLEGVVVDDGSTDGTAQIVGTFLVHSNVCLIRQANAGLPAARNRGLEAAQGELVCFLDSDDYLAPAHIARLVEVLEKDAETALAYANVQMVNETGSPCSTFSVGESRSVVSGDIFESLLVGGYFP